MKILCKDRLTPAEVEFPITFRLEVVSLFGDTIAPSLSLMYFPFSSLLNSFIFNFSALNEPSEFVHSMIRSLQIN